MEQSKVDKVDLERWARITIQRWQMRIGKIGFGPTSTGALIRSFNSLVSFIKNEANGDPQKVTFTFLFYGYYWDAGVGRGYDRGNKGDLKSLSDWSMKGGAGHRKKHRWFNKVYWREFNNLARLLCEQYGQEAIEIMKSIETHNYG